MSREKFKTENLMKYLKLFMIFLGVIFGLNKNIYGQCNVLIPSNIITGNANLGGSGSNVRLLCANDSVTGSGGGSNTFFMESGSYVNSAGGGSHIIYVKNNATLDISGGGGGITVYYEPNAIINNTLAGGGGNTFTMCATVTFDYSNFTQSPCNTTLSVPSVPPNNVNTIKVYPNPASTHITIDYGNYALMNGYTLQIVNALGQTMYTSPINQQSSYIDLTNWTGNGLYFMLIIDPQNNVIENRKIVIQ